VKTVYIVTQGDYSDYHIVGVFDEAHKQDAEALVERANGKGQYDQWRIEPFPLNDLAMVARKNLTAYRMVFTTGGELEGMFDYPIETSGNHYEPEAEWMQRAYDGKWITRVFARDEAHARKIAKDKWAQWKAEQEGIA
jgi:hypothetical protein